MLSKNIFGRHVKQVGSEAGFAKNDELGTGIRDANPGKSGKGRERFPDQKN